MIRGSFLFIEREYEMKTVLITGATSGIGEEFARCYAKMGYKLILVARRVNRMEALERELYNQYQTECRIIEADLSSEDACKALLLQLENEKIDLFINNAGFGTCGPFMETNLDKEIAMIHVNDIAMHILFKGMLIQMQKQGTGAILNVCSSAGLLPGGPYMATYYATKAYMVSLTRAVRRELKEAHSQITVSALCPGPVDTEFNQNADVAFSLKGISTKKCVASAIKGINRGKLIIVPGLTMKLATFFSGLLPKSGQVAVTGHQQKKKIYN